jgi:hypothetical protein
VVSTCEFCGIGLSFLERLTLTKIHKKCHEEQERLLAEYCEELNEMIHQLNFSEEARQHLERLVKRGKLAEEQTRPLGVEAYRSLKEEKLNEGSMSEAGREELRAAQQFLHLRDVEADAENLDRLRSLTFICEGNLPQVNTSIRLKKNETGHYEGPVKWCHLKTRRKRVAGSRGQSVRIAKGLSFKIGASQGYNTEWQELQTVDEGKVVLTSRRMLFIGKQKNLNVSYEKIMDLELYSDGVTYDPQRHVEPYYLSNG